MMESFLRGDGIKEELLGTPLRPRLKMYPVKLKLLPMSKLHCSAQCIKAMPAPAPALAQTPAALAQVPAAVYDSAESDSSRFQLNPEASRGSLFNPLCNLHKFVTP
uniref:Uncharacterized protein n=1 Tax=Opuntia streptacantha TaxID=393608 RepID=A0A7C8Z1H1_OPUST